MNPTVSTASTSTTARLAATTCTARTGINRGSWVWWGCESLSSRRKPLLLLAFGFNLVATVCITKAAIAITTSSSLTSVGWAHAFTTLSNLPECQTNSTTTSLTIEVWLGLKGYYGQCHGDINGEITRHSVSTLHHSDTFCNSGQQTTSTNTTDLVQSMLEESSSSLASQQEQQEQLFCSVLTGAVVNDAYNDTNCSACQDTSRDCVAALLSAAAFGIFPLILTVRRFCSTRPERGLRLRTLFFSGLAIILGLHSFVRFHLECVQTIPDALFAVVYSEECHQAQPFYVPTPMEFSLFTGGKLVIVAACLKVSYFILHLITPVAYGAFTEATQQEEEQALVQEKQDRNGERSKIVI